MLTLALALATAQAVELTPVQLFDVAARFEAPDAQLFALASHL